MKMWPLPLTRMSEIAGSWSSGYEALSLLQRQQELLFLEYLDRCSRDVRADPLLADG